MFAIGSMLGWTGTFELHIAEERVSPRKHIQNCAVDPSHGWKCEHFRANLSSGESDYQSLFHLDVINSLIVFAPILR